MLKHYILNEDRELVEVDLIAWATWFESADRTVAKTVIAPAKISVSTVFLGIDHNFGQDGPPIVYETMVFGGPCDGNMNRYATWDEAQEGHVAVVEDVRTRMEGLNVKPFPKRQQRTR